MYYTLLSYGGGPVNDIGWALLTRFVERAPFLLSAVAAAFRICSKVALHLDENERKKGRE